jgi:hypothetical protein
LILFLFSLPHLADTFYHLLALPLEQKAAEDRAVWTKWLERYQERLRKEIEGMSPEEVEKAELQRKQIMNATNPKVTHSTSSLTFSFSHFVYLLSDLLLFILLLSSFFATTLPKKRSKQQKKVTFRRYIVF